MTVSTTAARPRASSWLLFGLLVLISALALRLVGGVFPGDRAFAQLSRFIGYLSVDALLIAGSIFLLRRDGVEIHVEMLLRSVRRTVGSQGVSSPNPFPDKHFLWIRIVMFEIPDFQFQVGSESRDLIWRGERIW